MRLNVILGKVNLEPMRPAMSMICGVVSKRLQLPYLPLFALLIFVDQCLGRITALVAIFTV